MNEKIKKEDLESNYSKEYIIQPYLEFISEVQFYFLNNEFQYALEFIPSKIPVYPCAIEYKFNTEELEVAKIFAKLNTNFVGIQRIDFIKLNDGNLLLLEIEVENPYLDLDCLSKNKREQFLLNFKS